VVSVIVATTLAWFVTSGRWAYLDDAYITMHSARVLWEGIDRSYPGTPALVGITSPVHLGVVAAFLPFWGARTATLLTLWLSTIAFGVGIGVLASENRLSLPQAIACTIVALTVGFMPSQLANGLETALTLAVVTWALVLACRPERRDGVVLYILAGISPFVRPELALMTLAICAGRILERPRDAARALTITALAALPWAAWMFHQTGGVVPTTIRAKDAFFAERSLPLRSKLDSAVVSLAAFGHVIGALGVGLAGLWRSSIGRAGLLCGSTLIAGYALRFPSALHHYDGRYLYPLVPLLVAGLMMVIRMRPRFGLLLVVLILAHTVISIPGRLERLDRWNREAAADVERLAQWLNVNVPQGDEVVVHDAGFVSETTPFVLIDMVGLKTPSSIPVHAAITFPSGGRDRAAAIAEIITNARASYLVASDSFVPGLDDQLAHLGWQVEQLRPAAGHAGTYYRVFKVVPPKRTRS
jgi:hypothetical protein